MPLVKLVFLASYTFSRWATVLPFWTAFCREVKSKCQLEPIFGFWGHDDRGAKPVADAAWLALNSGSKIRGIYPKKGYLNFPKGAHTDNSNDGTRNSPILRKLKIENLYSPFSCSIFSSILYVYSKFLYLLSDRRTNNFIS